ncbi:MAG: hypothetical protein J7501_12005, partial [Bdellovibrio sp.]|nr:hypothetical protein [Bdellovibrio sp.]
LGIEFEVRSNSAGANAMLKYFKRTIGVEELVADRVQIIRDTADRLVKMRPQDADTIRADFLARERKTIAEGKIIFAVQNKMSQQTLVGLLKELTSMGGARELSDTFSFPDFDTVAKEATKTAQIMDSNVIEAEVKRLEEIFVPHPSCAHVFGGH